MKPLILGILNTTPDSFSDGGQYNSAAAAVDHAALLIREGADILDIGGESSRPGSSPITVQEEIERVLPVVDAIRARFPIPISIDTRKFEVGELAVRHGASIINDIEGGRDPRWLRLACEDVTFLLMHMRGTPKNMQDSPTYPNGVVADVVSFFRDTVKRFEEGGISRERIWLDPGIGFGKTTEHCLQLIKNADQFLGIGARVAIGTSRKSYLARLVGDPSLAFESRLPGAIASDLWAFSRGVSVFRAHEVLPLRRALQAWEAIHDAR